MTIRHKTLLASLVLLALGGQAQAEDIQSLFKLAKENDPSYKSVQSAHRASLENRPQSRARYLLPEISLSANTTYNEQDTQSSGIGGAGFTKFNSRGYSLNARQPVYHFDRYLELDQVEFRIAQSALAIDVALQDLIIRLSEAYFAVLGARDNVTFAVAEKNAFNRQLEQARQRFDVGLIAITDVQEAQAAYDLAFAEEIRANNELDNAYEQLREVTGQYHQQLDALGQSMPLVTPEPENIDAWTEIALKQNLELSVALLSSQTAEQEIRRQDAGHLPTLDLVGSTGYAKNGGRFGNSETDSSTLGFELNVPLYSGGQVSSRSRQASHLYQESLDKLEQQQRATQRQARNAYLGVKSGIGRVNALKQAVISTETALQATEAGFEVGTRTTVDVVVAQREVFRAKRDYAKARYDYLLDTLRLKRAAGTLSPEDLTAINEWLE
jgi:outer membrane protein